MRDEDELTAAVRKFVGQVSHWTPSRWAASSPSGPARADLVFALVQRVAELSPAAAGRRVPRLDSDLALPDQLRVVAADVLADAPTRAAEAAEAIRSVQRIL
jgi:hypothetical protein